jgi:hypothetical protein
VQRKVANFGKKRAAGEGPIQTPRAAAAVARSLLFLAWFQRPINDDL